MPATDIFEEALNQDFVRNQDEDRRYREIYGHNPRQSYFISPLVDDDPSDEIIPLRFSSQMREIMQGMSSNIINIDDIDALENLACYDVYSGEDLSTLNNDSKKNVKVDMKKLIDDDIELKQVEKDNMVKWKNPVMSLEL